MDWVMLTRAGDPQSVLDQLGEITRRTVDMNALLFGCLSDLVRVLADKPDMHSKSACGLCVGEGVANHVAVSESDPRVFCLGLREQTDTGFSAVALAFVVRADVNAGDLGTAFGHGGRQSGMGIVKVCRLNQASGDATLVRDDEQRCAPASQLGESIHDAGEQLELAPAADIGARQTAVDDAVAVEED